MLDERIIPCHVVALDGSLGEPTLENCVRAGQFDECILAGDTVALDCPLRKLLCQFCIGSR
jgi:hypothetical protein